MSLDVRHITNGEKTGYYVRDSLSETINFYESKEDIPENIQHYAKDGKPKLWGPDMARIMGCQSILYPDFPKVCGHTEYIGQNCIAESCKYAGKDYRNCKYLKD